VKVLGIDPGLHGGYALIGDDCQPLAELFPLAGNEVDLAEIVKDWFTLGFDLAVIEKVAAMPKQGVSSTFTFGRRFGELLGILAAMQVRTELVRPQEWKKVILEGSLKDKDAAIVWARRAYPTVNLIPMGCRTPKDGIAEALAIAEYGRLKYGRG